MIPYSDKVSIIVPVYNVEKHLGMCIDSIINQSHSNLEIILVNDGSPDNCGAICDEYASKDNRIRVVHKDNGGVSSARNAGMDIATGKYIGFVDSDDFIHRDMYSEMLKKINVHGDEICLCNYDIVFDNCEINIEIYTPKDRLSYEEILLHVIPYMLSSSNVLGSGKDVIMGSVCRLLINNEFLKNSEVRFDEEITYMEDLLFSTQLFLRAQNICICKRAYYYYRYNPDSVVNSYKKNFEETNERFFHKMNEVLKDYRGIPLIEKHMNKRYANMKFKYVINEVKHGEAGIFKSIKAIKTSLKDNKLREVLETENKEEYTLKEKMLVFMLYKNMPFFLYIYLKISNVNFLRRIYSKIMRTFK